jgi:hypothetical protein
MGLLRTFQIQTIARRFPEEETGDGSKVSNFT